MPLHAVFFDFTKTFDTVSRDGLCQVLTKFGCPAKFVSFVKYLHRGMQASVIYRNDYSKEFAVTTRVKPRCVLAPTLFSLYLSVTLEVAFNDSSDGVSI